MIKISKKYKKRKISKKALIITIIICLVAIGFMLNDTIKMLEENQKEIENIEQAKLSQSDKKMDTEIYEDYECSNISKEYVNDTILVNLDFNKDLYTNGQSNKEYFEGIIKELAKLYNRNFILKDSKKDIYILVDSQKNYTYSINHIEDYFEKAEEVINELSDYEKIETINNKISYSDFNKFKNNKWSIHASGVKIKSIENEMINYDSYKILATGFSIDNIFIDTNFKEEVIEGIKVGDEFSKIEKKLGAPAFETADCIGYKTNEIYIFFYKDEIVIYPNIQYENNKLEEKIVQYKNGNHSAILENLNDKDFKKYTDEQNNLVFESVRRGIKINISPTNDITIQIYNNYNITDKTFRYITEGIMINKLKEDLVFETEINRE